MMIHGRTESNGGRSAERPTRSRTGKGCTGKEDNIKATTLRQHASVVQLETKPHLLNIYIKLQESNLESLPNRE